MKIFEILANERKSPSGSKLITYFETAQGSKYVLSDKGESKRWKSSHANTGGDDKGAKGWYDTCLFVADKFQYEANSPQFLANKMALKDLAITIKGNKAAIYKRENNKWVLATWDDAYPKSKKGPIPLSFEFEKSPRNGLSTVEFINNSNHSLKSYHFGSEVSKVMPIDKAKDSDLSQIFN